VADNPTVDLVPQFDASSSYPSEGPRVGLDETVDILPFGDGSSLFPSLSQRTKEFWAGTGGPTKMWKIVAWIPSVDGTIVDFFSDINYDVIKSIMTDTIVPLAIEAL
jgi:hypothetical protein